MVCLVLGGGLTVSTGYGMPGGKEMSSVQTDNDEGERFEVTVKNGYIYITTQRTVNVQIYSILGQLVTQQVVQAGTTRIKAPTRGVYILKAGSITRRVTIN